MSNSLQARYLAAPTFEAFLEVAQKNPDLWRVVWSRAQVPDTFVQRAAALGGRWHLLVLSEDWCGDAVNILPVVARLAAEAPNLDLRVLSRDANADLMNCHLTGTSRSIPVVIILDERFEERGWWGPRPTELQAWVLGSGRTLPADERYRYVRGWYARDKGLTALEEILGLLEGAAGTP